MDTPSRYYLVYWIDGGLEMLALLLTSVTTRQAAAKAAEYEAAGYCTHILPAPKNNSNMDNEPTYCHPAELVSRASHDLLAWVDCFNEYHEQVYGAAYEFEVEGEFQAVFAPAYEKGQSVAAFFAEQFAPDDDREPNDY